MRALISVYASYMELLDNVLEPAKMLRVMSLRPEALRLQCISLPMSIIGIYIHADEAPKMELAVRTRRLLQVCFAYGIF